MTGDSSPVNSSDESTSLILFWALLVLFLGGVDGVGMGMTFLGVPTGGRSGRVLSNKNIKIFYVIIFYVIKRKLNCTFITFFQIFLAHHIVRVEKI